MNKPGDIFEQEADRIANQVINGPTPREVSGAPVRVQRFAGQSDGQIDAPASVYRALAKPGKPLEPTLRQDMEQRFGYDFSRVRVHSGAAAEQSARDVNAQAYTVGHDIVFGAGRFAPETPRGRSLLAHELTHAVQQSGGGGATKPDPQPIHSFSAAPRLARACETARCPAIALPVGPLVRILPAMFGLPMGGSLSLWQQAEDCLQKHYKKSHPGSTVGFNKDWAGLTGKNSREEATIECFRQYYSAKGFESDEARERRLKRPLKEGEAISVDRQGAAQRQAEPDIFDFTNLTIMEITTQSGFDYRAMKVTWEVEEATKLMDYCSIRGRKLWSAGTWRPSPCYQIVGVGPILAGSLFFRAQQVGGILIYEPVIDGRRAAAVVAAALAAAAAAAGARSGGSSSASEKSLKDSPPHTLPISPLVAAAIVAIAAFVVWLAKYIKPLRIAAFIGTLLGMLLKGLGLGLAVADDKGDYAGGNRGSAGGGGGHGPGPGRSPPEVAKGGQDLTDGSQTDSGSRMKDPAFGTGQPVETTTAPAGTVLPHAGRTSSPGGKNDVSSGAGVESLMDLLFAFLLRLLGINPASAAAAAGSGVSGGGVGPQVGSPAKSKVPVTPTIPPAPGTTPPTTGTIIPPKDKTLSSANRPARLGTARPARSRRTPTSPGLEKKTTGSTRPARSSSTLPRLEVGSIEGVDLKTISPGWYSFVYFNPGQSSEKLVLLGLIDIKRGDQGTIFEFRSGEGECTRQGCNGGRNTYIITQPRRTSATPELNGVVIFSDLKGFFPHTANLHDLADALEEAGIRHQANAIRGFAERQAK